MMLLEFLGMPAVGKTTTVNLLLRQQSINIQKLESISRGSNRIIIFSWDLATGCWLLKKNILKYLYLFGLVSSRSRIKLLNIVVKMGLLKNLSKVLENDIVVCDQLILQDLWSVLVFEQQIDLKSLDWFLNLYSEIISAYNLRIIFLDKDIDTIKRQYMKRENSKDIFSDTPVLDLQNEMLRSKQIMKAIASHLPRQQLIPVKDWQQLIEYLNENKN